MLTLAAPAPLIGALLAEQLAAQGLATHVALDGTTLILADLDEPDRAAAQAVVTAHPATAQAETNRVAREQDNETTIRDAAEQALAANRTFLALTNPTNAQVVAQVKALTRQNSALIRLALGRFDAAD